MSKYEVTFTVESDGSAKDDLVVTKIVLASSESEAVELARARMKEENRELNHMKGWASNTRPLVE